MWNIFFCFLVLLEHHGFHKVEETTPSPSLKGVASVGYEPCDSALPQFLVVSQTFVLFQADYYSFHHLKQLSMCQYLSASQRGGSQWLGSHWKLEPQTSTF